MLWSGLDEPTARRNLRHALHRLRSAGLGDVLVADDEQIAPLVDWRFDIATDGKHLLCYS